MNQKAKYHRTNYIINCTHNIMTYYKNTMNFSNNLKAINKNMVQNIKTKTVDNRYK
jgi:hypothetical protein